MGRDSLKLRVAFLLAFIATLGSLFFSEVLKYPPCVLCWYQRVCMYPLVLIFGVALWTGDRSVWRFSAPLITVGLAIAVYHNLLYYHVIPESITPCVQGISCTSRQVEWLGFITIPLLSLVGFLALAVLNLTSLLQGTSNEER